MKLKNKVFGALSAAYGRLKLRWKILLSYTLILVLLVIGLGIVTFWQKSVLVEDKFLTAVSGSLDQLATHISYRMQIVISSSEIVSWNSDLRRILTYQDKPYPLARQIDDIQIAKDTLLTIRANRDVLSVRLFMRGEGLLSRERDTFFSMGEIEDLS